MSDRVPFNAYQVLALNDALAKHQNALDRVDLRDLTLEGSDGIALTNAKLSRVIFAPLANAAPIDLAESELRACDVRDRAVTRSTWQEVALHDVQAHGAKLSSSLFRAVRASQCDFRTSAFEHCLMEGSSFEACDFSYTEWTNTTLTGARRPFRRTPLAHARFSACVFVGIDWTQIEDVDLIHFENCHFVGGRPPTKLPVGNLIAIEAEVETSVTVPVTAPETVKVVAAPPPATPVTPSRFSSLEVPVTSDRPGGER